ncbi:MAG: RecX family transcriptional regulator [Alphaproteobacteria bacterium]|nr:RecX family transcriptional regulator [Alphaproteobacteria bacterium]
MGAKHDRRAERRLPTEAELEEAALEYLARYSAPAARVAAVLERRVLRALRTQPDIDEAAALAEARRMIAAVMQRLAARGLLDDAAFSTTRSARLRREGRSRRAIAAHLLSRGVAADDVAGAFLAETDADAPVADAELAAAALFARRRRLGPFAPPLPADAPAEERAARRQRMLAAFARAGCARDTAERLLAMSATAAEALATALRRS